MNISANYLYNLLPAHYRERDATNGGVLRQYLEVLTDELVVVADGIEQLYDDLFIETAAPWTLPYLAELIGLQGIPGATTGGLTPRAEIANTIAYRRRKGTATVLEQLAHGVTGWPARAIEYFEILTSCQHTNHLRPRNHLTANLHQSQQPPTIASPFEHDQISNRADLTHLPDMRRISSHRGKYNVPNIGIFLWRLRAYPATNSPTVPTTPDDKHRFLINPLEAPLQLFGSPISEPDISHTAKPTNVPIPLTRQYLDRHLTNYYGPGLSLHSPSMDLSTVEVCDLSDLPNGTGNWAHTPVPPGKNRIDPILGRLACGDPQDTPPQMTYHYGFSADLGGGEYNRVSTFTTSTHTPVTVAQDGTAEHTTITSALDAIGSSGGVVEIRDSGRYEEQLTFSAVTGSVELRAVDQRRPVVKLVGDLALTLANNAEFSINGLILRGGTVIASGAGRLNLRHCTLVPGLDLRPDGAPAHPETPSLLVGSAETSVSLQRCIVGAVRSHIDADLRCIDTVMDAGQDGIALASFPDGSGPAGSVTFSESTIIGRVHVRTLPRASNSIFLAVVPPGDKLRWPGPMLVDRRQDGCVRFCFLPAGSRTPRRYRCVPTTEAEAAELRPVFTSSRYGHPGYGQLDRRTPSAVARGGEGQSEMGAFHHLQQPQREAYLNARVEEYLRFGLEAGLFFAT